MFVVSLLKNDFLFRFTHPSCLKHDVSPVLNMTSIMTRARLLIEITLFVFCLKNDICFVSCVMWCHIKWRHGIIENLEPPLPTVDIFHFFTFSLFHLSDTLPVYQQAKWCWNRLSNLWDIAVMYIFDKFHWSNSPYLFHFKQQLDMRHSMRTLKWLDVRNRGTLFLPEDKGKFS